MVPSPTDSDPMVEEDAPDTLRQCGACQSDACCSWCDNGFQTKVQHALWVEFQVSDQSFLESTVFDIIDRLSEEGSDRAFMLVLEGQKLFEDWSRTKPAYNRADATEALTAFNRHALDFLQSRK